MEYLLVMYHYRFYCVNYDETETGIYVKIPSVTVYNSLICNGMVRKRIFNTIFYLV